MKSIKNLKIAHFVSLVTTLFLVNWTVDAAAYQTQSNNQNRVRVDVRPIQLSPGKPAKFEIRMNTHSGDLSQDLIAVCTLTDSSGVVDFPEVTEGAESITLVIREVANVPERIFNWSIER